MATSVLQPQLELCRLQLTGGRRYLEHCHRLPLGELVRHSQSLLQEEGREEEEAQEGEADDLCPTSRGQ